MKYYVRPNPEAGVQGPFTVDELLAGIESGSIPKNALASSDLGETHEQLGEFRGCDWFPIAHVPGLHRIFPPPLPWADEGRIKWQLRLLAALFAVALAAAAIWHGRYAAALVGAIRAGDIPAARQAISDGASVKQIYYRDGSTALHLVAKQGSIDMAKLLMEHGAAEEISVTNRDGDTASDVALANGHAELAEYLRSLTTTNR